MPPNASARQRAVRAAGPTCWAAPAVGVSTALRLTTWDAVNNQLSSQNSGSVITTRISSDPAAPTAYDTVVVFNPTDSDYTTALPAGSWTKVLDGNGATSSSDTTSSPRAVTVFKKN
ncbi:hypothetical protein [Kitasatospora sp. NBC_00315]|uniref:hypothetical protein n=1 Tax=Kitasatospora sp. NBC_00315 TaxID=2975963 RepID=UPI0032444152